MFSEGNLLSFTSQENLKFSQTNVVSDSHQCQSLKLHFDKRFGCLFLRCYRT